MSAVTPVREPGTKITTETSEPRMPAKVEIEDPQRLDRRECRGAGLRIRVGRRFGLLPALCPQPSGSQDRWPPPAAALLHRCSVVSLMTSRMPLDQAHRRVERDIGDDEQRRGDEEKREQAVQLLSQHVAIGPGAVDGLALVAVGEASRRDDERRDCGGDAKSADLQLKSRRLLRSPARQFPVGADGP